MRKRITALATAAAMAAFASPAMADVITINIVGASGSYEQNDVDCPAAAPCAFEDSGTFVTPVGYNLVAGSITSTDLGGGTNIDFTEVTLNGVLYNLVNGVIFSTGELAPPISIGGALNELIVKGTTAGNASYSGTFAFAAVPEPATWAMMLIGFAGIGVALRRRRRDMGAGSGGRYLPQLA